jgi:hypothetical protein
LDLAVKAPGVYVDLKQVKTPADRTGPNLDLVAMAVSSMARRFYKPGDDFAFPLLGIITHLEIHRAAGVEGAGAPVDGWADIADASGTGPWDYGWCALVALRDVTPWIYRVRNYVALTRHTSGALATQPHQAKAFLHMARAFAALIQGWIAETSSSSRERQDFLGFVQGGLVEATRAFHDAARGLAGNAAHSGDIRALAAGAQDDLNVLLRKVRLIQEQAAMAGKGFGF